VETVGVSGRVVRTVPIAAGLALVLAASVLARPDAPIRLRITGLTGSVVRLGSVGSEPLYGVRLRARICFSSAAMALSTTPDETRITHFAVSKLRTRWWAARTTIDRAPWLVSFGENWGGKACGPALFQDAIPASHYGVESLGNPNGCYGVSLTIKARGEQASRRIVVTCGHRFS
jgi:hypothetical protein